MANPLFGSFRIDENGNITGGKPGDQNGGKEVSTQTGYIHSKGWIVAECIDYALALKIAAFMKALCANNNIGYNQNARTKFLAKMKAINYDLSKLDGPIDGDCSSGVVACCRAAGINVANFTTSNEMAALKATGMFKFYTTANYCKSTSLWLPGMILFTKVKGHTGVVLTKGSKAVVPTLPTTPSTPEEPVLEKGILVTGSTVNIRTGPGTGYPKAGAALKKGTMLQPLDMSGWRPVLIDGQVRWISETYSKEVK